MASSCHRNVKNSLQKIYYILGEGFSKGFVFLVFHIFTNGLDKTDFGKLSLFWISIPVISIFIDLAQRSYVKRYYLYGNTNVFTLIGNIYILSTLIFLILTLVKSLLSFFGIYLIDSKMDIYLMLASYLFVLTEPVLSYLQIKGDSLKYSLLYVFRSAIAYVITAGIFLFIVKDLYIYPVVYILTLAGLVLLLLRRIIAKSDKFNFGSFKISIKKSLRFSLPLTVGVLSAIGLNAADRFIINFYLSEVDVANYTVAYTSATLFMAFFMATNKWWQKFILDALNNNERDKISRKFHVYLLVVLLVGIMVFLFREFIVLVLSNDQYSETIEIVPILLIGMFFYFLYSVLINVPFFYEKTKIQILPALIAVILNILLNILLIPKYGYKIAAWTTCISYFVEFLIMYVLCIKIFKIDFIFNITALLKDKNEGL